MHKLTLLLALGAAIAVVTASAATATPPQHFHFSSSYSFVDDQTCSFPVVGNFVFTNDGTEFDNALGTIESLQLHQSNVGTLAGNGVTLKENEHIQTFVTFADGTPTQAVHVGVLFHMVGPAGTVFLVAGQEVWEVEHGFDHTLISFHGVDFGGDDAAFCAAFA